MKNYVMEGEKLELTAPVGGVVSGKAYKIGALIVVATVTKAAGEKFVGITEGVVKMPKGSLFEVCFFGVNMPKGSPDICLFRFNCS